MDRIRSRLFFRLARRFGGGAGSGGGGFDLSSLRFLPPEALLALRRDGVSPVAELGAARERAPISRIPAPLGLRAWLVTGYAEAKAVLADATTFSSDFSHLSHGSSALVASPGGLGFADPPAHTRLRHILTPEFTMRRLGRLIPRINEIVDATIDAMDRPGPVDLVTDFALPIPSQVICELLGVPYADRDEFQRYAQARFNVDGGSAPVLDAMTQSLNHLRRVVRRQRNDPDDSLLGMIVREHGDEIDDEELAGLADGVLTGGFETTSSMLSLGTLVLLQNGNARGYLADPSNDVAPAVEELLRFLSVVQVAFPRFARSDTVVCGTPIARGDVVVVSLSGADRDAVLGPDMNDVELSRVPVSHLAFGHGIHRCIGAELARMQLRIALPALVRRFPNLRLAVAPEEIRFRRVSIVYGADAVPVFVQ